MKVLFLIFHGFSDANGITKKIRYQIKALADDGMDVRLCHYHITDDGHRQWVVNGEVISDLGCGVKAKIKKRISYRPITDYVGREKIDWVYIRSYHNANPFTIALVKTMRRLGAKVVMEIPTYPYDREYSTFRRKLDLFVDRLFRRSLAAHLNNIVTFSNEDRIFGCPTLRISNGIDFDSIPLKQHVNDLSGELHLIGVAEIHFWHGFDRVVKGLAAYYQSDPAYKVYFHIVGNLNGELERQEILPVIEENHLEQYVILHGARSGAALDELFEKADCGVGSLGRHRSGIIHIKTLKNREYAARGIPFIYSEIDDDFEHQPYILKAPADETPIDIRRLIDFCRSLSLTPPEIRKSIRHLSWDEQMQRVIDSINK